MLDSQDSGDIIQLCEDAVRHLLPNYATEDDMYDALDKCGMRESEIFRELDERVALMGVKDPSLTFQADTFKVILLDRFLYELDGVLAHKAPL